MDSQGQERINDLSVGWNEEIEGERLSFDEYWFIVDEAELEKMRMYGIFTETRAVSTVIGKLRWSLNRQAHIIVVYWSV
ncbi:MAG: hypothetical protein HFH85_18650 [Lachnospiraceae bacterium]|nr:hypothetical protein [Lachnospiraceae bacterium]